MWPILIWSAFFFNLFFAHENRQKRPFFSPPTSRPGQNRIRRVFFRVFPILDNLFDPKNVHLWQFFELRTFFPPATREKVIAHPTFDNLFTFSDFFWPSFFAILDRFLQLYPFFRPRNLLNLEKWRRFVVLIYFLVFVSWGSRLYTDSLLNPLTYFSIFFDPLET